MVPQLTCVTRTLRRLHRHGQHNLLHSQPYTGSTDFNAEGLPMTVLLKTDPTRAARWAAYFAEHAPDVDFRIWPNGGKLSDVRYFIGWQADRELIAAMPNLEVFFASGAGVDHLDFSTLPSHVPLVRMVEPGIVDSMAEYACMSILALHRDLLHYARAEPGTWQALLVRPASQRTVGVMGLGVLGLALLERLAPFGFERIGWNRSARELPGVKCYAGAAERDEFLARCDILVCLLPLTSGTRGMLGRDLFAALPRGAAILNVGRGAHLDQDALLDALAEGHLRAAVLDVTDPEPLPANHPLWRDPRVLITPHIAAMTQPETAAPVLLANLRRHMAGQPLHDVVDRQRGY
jgi:glyoxylate/hydroxypyruvate reductase A